MNPCRSRHNGTQLPIHLSLENNLHHTQGTVTDTSNRYHALKTFETSAYADTSFPIRSPYQKPTLLKTQRNYNYGNSHPVFPMPKQISQPRHLRTRLRNRGHGHPPSNQPKGVTLFAFCIQYAAFLYLYNTYFKRKCAHQAVMRIENAIVHSTIRIPWQRQVE